MTNLQPGEALEGPSPGNPSVRSKSSWIQAGLARDESSSARDVAAGWCKMRAAAMNKTAVARRIAQTLGQAPDTPPSRRRECFLRNRGGRQRITAREAERKSPKTK